MSEKRPRQLDLDIQRQKFLEHLMGEVLPADDDETTRPSPLFKAKESKQEFKNDSCDGIIE